MAKIFMASGKVGVAPPEKALGPSKGREAQGDSEREVMCEQFERLEAFIASTTSVEPVDARVDGEAARKIAHQLNEAQIKEFLTDVSDEIDRRQRIEEGQRGSGSDCIEERAVYIFNGKYPEIRNQARLRLTKLPTGRFVKLAKFLQDELTQRFSFLSAAKKDGVTEVAAVAAADGEQIDRAAKEISTMHIRDITDTSIIEAEDESRPSSVISSPSNNDTAVTMEPNQMRRPSSEYARSVAEKRGGRGEQVRRASILEDRLTRGRTFNFEWLDALMSDMDRMVDEEQSLQAAGLRERHIQEVGALKEYIQQLEEQVIPEQKSLIEGLSLALEEARLQLADKTRQCKEKDGELQARDSVIEQRGERIWQLQDEVSRVKGALQEAQRLVVEERAACEERIASTREECDRAVCEKAEQVSAASGRISKLQDELQEATALALRERGARSASVLCQVEVAAATISKITSQFALMHEGAMQAMKDEKCTDPTRMAKVREACALFRSALRESERLCKTMDVKEMPQLGPLHRDLGIAHLESIDALTRCLSDFKRRQGGGGSFGEGVGEVFAELSTKLAAINEALQRASC